MQTANQKTLHAYELRSASYIDKTPSVITGTLKVWIDEAVEGLPLNSRIFEIGSGDGRDADYIESLGYEVECSDTVQSYVSTLLAKGFNARLHDAILDPIMGSYDLIFANAVLPHFTQEEAMLVTSKVLTALKPRGRFAFSLKEGRNDFWATQETKDAVRCHYWSRKQVETMLKNTGFNRWTIHEEPSGLNSADGWLQIVAYKMG